MLFSITSHTHVEFVFYDSSITAPFCSLLLSFFILIRIFIRCENDTPCSFYRYILMAVILAFFIFTKTPQGDWNIKKGGNLMSKRNHARSNRRTTRPAKYRLQLRRKEARKRAKHQRKIYYRQTVVPHCRCKGA